MTEMKAVRLDGNLEVVEVFGADKAGLVGKLHNDILDRLHDAAAEVQVGWQWNDLLSTYLPVSEGEPLPPTADDVRAEASRRMQSAFGARDAAHLALIIENGTREAVRLLRIKEDRAWTEAEAARSAQLAAADMLIEVVRAASNALEAMQPVPADYAEARWWSANLIEGQ